MMTIAFQNHIENLIINKPKKQGLDLLEEREINYRILRADKVGYCITDDIDLNRFNLEIDNDIVTNIFIG